MVAQAFAATTIRLESAPGTAVHCPNYSIRPSVRTGSAEGRDHPPILLGGSARQVFHRVIAWGDGWMPVRATPEDVKKGRATLDELAAAAGRDPKSIDVTVFGESSDPEAIQRFEASGANRVIVRLSTTLSDSALTELEQMAAQVLS